MRNFCKIRLAIWLFIITVSLPASLSAQNVELDVIERSLENGMKILMVERHDSPTVALYLRFRVGGVDDPQGRTGIAHLLEHMMFKGTKIYGTTDFLAEVPWMEKTDRIYLELDRERRKHGSAFEEPDETKAEAPAATQNENKDETRIAQLEQEMTEALQQQREYIVKDELWQTYQRLGGTRLNASTGRDSTQYFVQLPSNQLEVWAFLESDRLANPVFREFYPERDVVHEERRMRTDTRPSGLLWEVFHSTAFQSHSYRNPVIGWAGDLDNMTREEVLEYFKTFYAPNNAIAAIVGDIDPDKTMAIMEKYFGPLQAQTLPRRSITEEPRQRGERRVTISLDAQPQMHIGYHIPQIGHEDSYALDVLGQLFSGVSRGSRTGRLYKSLVLEKKVALRASAGPMTSLYPSLFVFSATPARGKSSQELEEAIYEEIVKLQQEPPSEEELTRVRNAVEASAIRSLRSNFGIARVIAASEHLAGSWRYLLTEREKLKAVTAEDVQNVAKKYFAEENRTVAEIKSKSRQGGAADTPPPATAERLQDIPAHDTSRDLENK
ncbi:MAG: pitrilysin family protein [Acidobacteria bacterium]|nr:pitrilysin family protein [Acidobacteriota bacterium]